MENTACFTGHRPDSLYGYDPTAIGNYNIIKNLRDLIIDHIENHEVDSFITGMALGIDTWAARIVLKLKETYPHIKLIAAVPCANHSNRWNQQSKDEWQMIIDKCDTVHYVSNEGYTHWCMDMRNRWMVDNSSRVIAVWNGGNSGTGNCVKYARKMEKDVITLHPKTLEIKSI